MPLLLWPGLAADARLFAPIRERLENVQTPRFMEPSAGESLRDYAQRYAPTLAPQLPHDGRYAVGGFSFGGQLALELAAVLQPRPKGVVLICGVRGTHQILPAFGRQQRLGAAIPGAVARRLYKPVARRFAQRNRLDDASTRLLLDMAQDIDPRFLRWSAAACARWPGPPELDLPIRHIHGQLDTIIPDVRHEADRTIAGARHLITLTHPQEVAEFIMASLADFDNA